MVKIHEGFIRFLEQDLFNARDLNEDVLLRSQLEDELFDAGVKRFNKQLTRHLMSLAKKENIQLTPLTNVFYYIDKLYLFMKDDQFILFEFPEGSSNSERLDLLLSNSQSIIDKAWENILSNLK